MTTNLILVGPIDVLLRHFNPIDSSSAVYCFGNLTFLKKNNDNGVNMINIIWFTIYSDYPVIHTLEFSW